MKIEHFALNVSAPIEMANWYCQHLGMTAVSKMEQPPYTCFLADNSRNVMIEIYSNKAAPVPDYASTDPLVCHLAFVSDDPSSDIQHLIKAGATLVSEFQPGDGTHLAMLRDPWGFAIQLCKRAKPMLKMQQ
jgi:catechol-2,3-dioxygenase